MSRRGRGSVVNVSSLRGFGVGGSGLAYATAEVGTIELRATCSAGCTRIRVNCVARLHRARLVQESIDRAEDTAAAEGAMVSGRRARLHRRSGEVAQVVRFIIGRIGLHVTGASLLVDGGLIARRAG